MMDFEHQQTTQCAVYDQTPGSMQKKINIIVRPHYTVNRIIDDLRTQYSYFTFDLVLQPINESVDLVHLNEHGSTLLYDIKSFIPTKKNFLVLLPPGAWDGNTKRRYNIGMATKQQLMFNDFKSTAAASINNNNNNNGGSHTNSNSDNNNALKQQQQQQQQMHLAAYNQREERRVLRPAPILPDELTILDDESNDYHRNSMADDEPIKQELIHILPRHREMVSDSLNLSPVSDQEQLSEDDLALGASASPTETEPMNGGIGGLTFNDSQLNGSRLKYDVINESDNDLYDQAPSAKSDIDKFYDRKYHMSAPSPNSASGGGGTNSAKGYVGLVNQAMTCYLNSLLQALYMTPEFRNALYRWESDNDNEAKNIPYQLQKLFLNLQTSHKNAVETTDLTRSFGWDSTEAWQQHDIQELCRVMFDALEHKFKNTKQANLISNLYEGKMIDYVKCLECDTEKTRADTFLDIPLPVRPFGNTVAYGSIEEALRAFVQPETLDGNNQYFCEKCNKKCDAHKGLKFKNFPYVLTLHLKRFDFDYQTMHRIKLNDKVTFPQSLNLNSFVNATDVENYYNLQSTGVAPSASAAVVNGSSNLDDCSTADSGSAMEEDNCSSGVVTTASSSQHENDMNDDDEGIDMSTSTSTDHHRLAASNSTVHSSKTAAVQRLKQESGPFLYELFAIMIHSGSASGGHYYAYIKEFENNEWFCFNDQSVSPLTQEDIQKSFGGAPTNSYYSSVYSSSTNAYMLMYRQVDPKRNEHAMKEPDLPRHIKTLMPKLQAEEENRSTRLGRHSTVTDLVLPDLLKPRVYFYNPLLKKMKVTRIYVSQSFNVNLVLESAYKMLNVSEFAPLEHCRLVAYDSASEEILQSFENIKDPALTELRSTLNCILDFLLEYRSEGQEFEVYEKDGTTWYVFIVNLSTMEMSGPFFIYSAAHEQNDVLRHSIAVRLNVNEDELLLASVRGTNKKAFVAYDPHPTPEAQENLQTIATSQFRHLTFFYLNVPNTDPANLEIMGIPIYETQTPAIEVSTDVVDAVVMNGGVTHAADVADHGLAYSGYNRESPLPPTAAGHESNSEDSSLSDGDRTLVECLQNRGGGDSQVSSTSHSPQLSSPEDESATPYSIMRVQAYYTGFGDNPEPPTLINTNHSSAQYFHASKIDCLDITASSTTTNSGNNSDDEAISRKPTHSYKLIVSAHMRMGVFHRHIESLIRVPRSYFKLQRKHDPTVSNNPTNSLILLNEGETLTVELGKVLQADEHKAKIYYMRLTDLSNDTGKLPCVCEWVYNTTTTVEMAKKELVAKLHRIDAARFKTLSVDNIRLWLKGGRSPIKILANEDLVYNDLRTTIASEFLVQECEDGVNPQPDDDSLTIFVRRWHPDKLQLDKFQEITLDKECEILNLLSKISDIPEDKIAYTKINSTFPCTNISVLSVNSSMNWSTNPVTLDKYPLTTTFTGHVYFYKDMSKLPKELTSDEMRELNAKEKARLDRLGCISTSRFSPRRERALKIYLDSPQTTTLTASAPMDASSARSDD